MSCSDVMNMNIFVNKFTFTRTCIFTNSYSRIHYSYSLFTFTSFYGGRYSQAHSLDAMKGAEVGLDDQTVCQNNQQQLVTPTNATS